MIVIKRDKSEERYNLDKIKKAVKSAFKNSNTKLKNEDILFKTINSWLEDKAKDNNHKLSIEYIQDTIESVLMKYHYFEEARAYIIYREEHKNTRLLEQRIDYMDTYSTSKENAASSSNTDANANTSIKNVASLEAETYKDINRQIQRQRMKGMLHQLYPNSDIADAYKNDLNHHIIYTHDEASTPVPKFYCQADALFPLMTEGVGNMDGTTPTPPNDLHSFSGQITNLVFMLSSQCKGAVALGGYFIALNYYIIKDFGNKWYDKLDVITTNSHCVKDKTIRTEIYEAFKQFVWGINQPQGNRSYQSPFTNVSYYDKTYFNSMFGSFYYPDSTQPEWKAIDTVQRLFMNWFNKLRTKSIVAFPVETMAMVYDPKTNDIIDKEYKDLTATMYAKGHSFFTYISDSADSLASCCFSKDTKVLWKESINGVHNTTLEYLHNLKWEDKKNFKIYHNGAWVKGKSIKQSNRPMYKVTTQNNKVYYMTDNHINVTYNGEITTDKLTLSDYLMYNTKALESIKENDENLTYNQGILIGLFIGDGSFGSYKCLDGSVHGFQLSLNKDKWNKVKNILNTLGDFKLGTVCNNVYPLYCNNKDLTTFISKWTNCEPGNTTALNKNLNINCILQSKEFRQGILDGWYITDGGNSNRCYTISKSLIESMEILCTSLGKQCIINISDRTDEDVIIRGEVFNRNYPLYCLRWYDDTNNRCRPESGFKWKNNSIYWKIKSIESVCYYDSVYCIECDNKDEPYFTLPSGLITHNCRLRNKLSKNVFSPTSGLTGIQTGSCNVITLNINRIVQDCFSLKFKSIEPAFTLEDFIKSTLRDKLIKSYLIEILSRVYKYHIAYKTILYDWEDRGMFTCCNANYIRMNKLYSTIGINGLNEAARYLGMVVNKNEDYIKFLQLILSTIKEQNTLNSIYDNKRPFIFNSEVVPAESLGGKNYRWDKEDGYVVPKDENLYNSYFFSQSDSNISVLDKMYLHGKCTYQYTDGGSACHVNLKDHLSKSQYLKLIDYAIANGTSYFTFNIPNSKCDDCGYITKHPIVECPKCHSKHITQYTRIIG